MWINVKINTYNICMLRDARASFTGEHDETLIVKIPVERRENLIVWTWTNIFAMDDRLMKSVM